MLRFKVKATRSVAIEEEASFDVEAPDERAVADIALAQLENGTVPWHLCSLEASPPAIIAEEDK